MKSANMTAVENRIYNEFESARLSLQRFGIHPANDRIRAELILQRDRARAELERRGFYNLPKD